MGPVRDIDGDGKPEVVFQTDMGGGMGCCWECNVTSLYPKPHKLFDVYGARLEKDVQGKMLVWVPTTGPMGFTSMAQAPYAERVYRVQEGKLVEVTQDFCGRIFSTQSVYTHPICILTAPSLRWFDDFFGR